MLLDTASSLRETHSEMGEVAVPDQFQATLNHAHHHVAIRVHDLDKMSAFYGTTMGLPYIRQAGEPGNPRVIWYRGVQLVKSDAPGDAKQGTMDHLAVSVLKIDDIVARLEAAGTPMEAPMSHSDVAEIGEHLDNIFFRDPEGNRVELVQWTPLHART
jgi:catechol 2,3-dioxygenase-like lactoylglutathione lyase family enzyme